MLDSESIKKMLRSVLQSSKAGVSISHLQRDYRSLCGESIPLQALGFSSLEDYLKSIPSVVRMQYHMGEIKCFAGVCKETANIAELVANQKSSKKSGRSQVVNCKMRFKPFNPYMLNDNQLLNQLLNPLYNSVSCLTETVTEKPPEQVTRLDQSQSCLYDVELVQSRIILVLKKHYSGFWMSKLPGVYSGMFKETLHPQVLIDLKKWTHIIQVDNPPSTNRADRLIYPPLPPKPSIVPGRSTTNMPPTSPTDPKTITTPISSHPSTHVQPSSPSLPSPVPKPRVSHQAPLAEPTFFFPPQPDAASSSKPVNSVTLRSPARNPALAPQLPSCVNLALGSSGQFKQNPNMPTASPNRNPNSSAHLTCPASTGAPSLASPLQPGSGILPLLTVTFSPTFDSIPCSPPTSSAVVVSAEVRRRIKELLTTCSRGLWAHALPKLFMDTYKTPFPNHILDNLSLFPDIFSVEYPIPHNKKKFSPPLHPFLELEQVDGCVVAAKMATAVATDFELHSGSFRKPES
ncbi:Tudor domain-containing protein 7A [Liparis tanakae]|uniref:Tudor domain-containing protein 7A n=1 Tax=Liparis tanakae TaxID=230148 RepID=A0A4Z2HFK0_9TELE|nr:Tudor domain-containing protein 7A [Liparis tanakae]